MTVFKPAISVEKYAGLYVETLRSISGNLNKVLGSWVKSDARDVAGAEVTSAMYAYLLVRLWVNFSRLGEDKKWRFVMALDDQVVGGEVFSPTFDRMTLQRNWFSVYDAMLLRKLHPVVAVSEWLAAEWRRGFNVQFDPEVTTIIVVFGNHMVKMIEGQDRELRKIMRLK